VFVHMRLPAAGEAARRECDGNPAALPTCSVTASELSVTHRT